MAARHAFYFRAKVHPCRCLRRSSLTFLRPLPALKGAQRILSLSPVFCASGEFYLMLFLRRHLIENFYTPSSFFITNYVTRSPFLLVWSEERGPTLLFRDTSLRSRTKASETLNLPRPDGSLLVLNSLSIFNSVQFQDFLLFLTS